MGKLLNKADIFAKKALDPRTVHVPEWGGDVKYKPMTMVERKEVRKRSTIQTTDKQGTAVVEVDQETLELWSIITCTLDPTDETGVKTMFVPDDLKTLEEEMAAGAISTLSTAILQASGLAPNAFRDSEEEAKK